MLAPQCIDRLVPLSERVFGHHMRQPPWHSTNSVICITCQRMGEPNLAPLLAVLAGATALRKLCMLAYTSPQAFGHCGLLCQLTALEVGPLTGRLQDSHLDDCLWGLTQLQRLRLHFKQGATAVLVLCCNITQCNEQQSRIGLANCAVFTKCQLRLSQMEERQAPLRASRLVF